MAGRTGVRSMPKAPTERTPSPTAYRRNERDFSAIAWRLVPCRKVAIDRHAQLARRKWQGMPRLQLVLERTQVGRCTIHDLACDTRRVAQCREVQDRHPGHHAFPKSWRPPLLRSSFAGPTTMRCDSALHMS